jgi:hypothetical protein
MPGKALFSLSILWHTKCSHLPRFAVQRSVLNKKSVTKEKILDLLNHAVLCSKSPLTGLRHSMRKRTICLWMATQSLSRSNRKKPSQPQFPVAQERRSGTSPRRRPGARPWKQSRKTCRRGLNRSVWWCRSIVYQATFADGPQRSTPAAPEPGWYRRAR